MSNEIEGVSPSGTLYARLRNPAGLWWNGTDFEAYSASDYANYVIAMTEEGDSGVYVADFPTTITASGTYKFYVHRTTTSAAEGDLVVNTGFVDWTGSTSVAASPGAMTGSDWLSYFLRKGFKRTDKDTEIYEATTDAVQELRRRFMFDEAEVESTVTDTITVLGDFKMELETDFGLLLGIIVEDDDTGVPLVKLSKSAFDQYYPSINVEDNRGFPKHFCVYGGNAYIGPAPDQVDYVYRQSYSRRAGTVTSTTAGVPFTDIYRDILADNVNARMWEIMEEFDKAQYFRGNFEFHFDEMKRRERVNSGQSTFNQRSYSL